jgi:hypothetical protein
MRIVRSESRYYVYEWFRPDTGECFYTGKGSGQRAWSFYSRNHQFMRILDELYENKLYPSVHIYKDNLTSKRGAENRKGADGLLGW